MAVSEERTRAHGVAGALLAGAWEAEGLKARLLRATAAWGKVSPKLVRRVMLAFRRRPGFGELVGFVREDRKFREVLVMEPERREGEEETKREMPSLVVGEMDGGLGGVEVPEIGTVGALASWLGVRVGTLAWLADVQGRNWRQGEEGLRLYRCRWVPRREGAPRLLEVPVTRLKLVQGRILREVLDGVPAHEAAHGFRAGRGIVTNAAAHCGRAVVVRMDLADFFASVTAARVFGIFRTLGYPVPVARLLMGLCSTGAGAEVVEEMPFEVRQQWRTRHLPQGAPTSPALANLAAHRLDRRLAGLARVAGAMYTRYADDLTFSGDTGLARGAEGLVARVGAIALEEGFRVNFRKTRVMGAGVRQVVTGLTVNAAPNVGRKEYERLKAVLTNCVRHGAASQNREGREDFRAWLEGKVGFVEAVHAGRGGRLRGILERVRWGG